MTSINGYESLIKDKEDTANAEMRSKRSLFSFYSILESGYHSYFKSVDD